MKIFLSLFLVAALSTGVLADTICRQPEIADFGPAVTARSGNGFIIAQGCAEDSLVAQKPISLSVLFGHGAQNTRVTAGITPPSWTVLFELDRADLDDSTRLILDQIPPDAMVRVTGYSCQVGSEGYNLRLSRQRAQAVATYLRKRGATITFIEGMGECCPASTTDPTKNRRVIIEEEK